MLYISSGSPFQEDWHCEKREMDQDHLGSDLTDEYESAFPLFDTAAFETIFIMNVTFDE